MKKIAIILTGGGARGAFQAGAWECIQKSGINFGDGVQKVDVPNAVFGVSAGALNGAMIAMGKHTELTTLWNSIAGNPQEIYTSDFLKTDKSKTTLDIEALGKYLLSDVNALQKVGLLFKKSRNKTLGKVLDKVKALKGLSDNTPLFNKVKDLIHLKDMKSEVFQAGFVSLKDGNYYSLQHTDFTDDTQLQKAILASSCIPLVWSPVDRVRTGQYEVSQLIDGGIRNVTPLSDAIKYAESHENDECYFLVISCHSQGLKTMQEAPNLFSIIERSIFDIAMNEIRITDLKEFLRINDLVRQAQEKGVELHGSNGKRLKSFKIKIIQPQRELGAGLDFSRDVVQDSFTHGFQCAQSVIQSPHWE